MKHRIVWLDMAKGYGILFVISAHIGVGIIGTWIYSFHIPLFFLLSGYVFNASNSFDVFFKKKCKSILLPYFCLGLPMVVVKGSVLYKNNRSFSECLRLLRDFLIQRRMWTLWFLACLFFLNIFFYAVLRVLKKKRRLIIFSVITTVVGLLYYNVGGGALPWNIDVCLMAFPFFLGGYLYKEEHEKIDKYLDNKSASIILFILLGMVNLICGYYTIKISGRSLEMYASSYGFAPLTYLSAFAGSFCVIIVSKWVTIKPIQYIGRNSLLYFAWHQTIMIPIVVRCLNLMHVTVTESSSIISVGIYKLVQFIMIIVLLTFCNAIMIRTRLKFMLGK